MHQLSKHSIGASAASHAELQRPLINVHKSQGTALNLQLA